MTFVDVDYKSDGEINNQAIINISLAVVLVFKYLEKY